MIKRILCLYFLLAIVLTFSCNKQKPSDSALMPGRIAISDADGLLITEQTAYGANGNLYKSLKPTARNGSEVILPVDFFDVNGNLMEAPRVMQIATIDEDYLIAEIGRDYFLIEKKDGKLWQIPGDGYDLRKIQRDAEQNAYVWGVNQFYRLNYKSTSKTIKALFVSDYFLSTPLVLQNGDIAGMFISSSSLGIQKKGTNGIYVVKYPENSCPAGSMHPSHDYYFEYEQQLYAQCRQTNSLPYSLKNDFTSAKRKSRRLGK